MNPGSVTVNSDGSVTGNGAALIIYNGLLAQQRQAVDQHGNVVWPATVTGGTSTSYGIVGGTDVPTTPPTGLDPNTVVAGIAGSGMPLYDGTASAWSASILVALLAIKKGLANQANGIAQAFGQTLQNVKNGDPLLQIVANAFVRANPSGGGCTAAIPIIGGTSGQMGDGDQFTVTDATLTASAVNPITLNNPNSVSIEDPNSGGTAFVTTAVTIVQKGATVIWQYDATNVHLKIL